MKPCRCIHTWNKTNTSVLDVKTLWSLARVRLFFLFESSENEFCKEIFIYFKHITNIFHFFIFLFLSYHKFCIGIFFFLSIQVWYRIMVFMKYFSFPKWRLFYFTVKLYFFIFINIKMFKIFYYKMSNIFCPYKFKTCYCLTQSKIEISKLYYFLHQLYI